MSTNLRHPTALPACDVTASDFEDYVNELRGKGFTVGLAKSSDTFTAENAAGDKVMVMHNPKERHHEHLD